VRPNIWFRWTGALTGAAGALTGAAGAQPCAPTYGYGGRAR
jgi:hypothetical protein